MGRILESIWGDRASRWVVNPPDGLGWLRKFPNSCSMSPSLTQQTPPAASRSRARDWLMGLQESICAGLEALDGEGRFQEESWERPEGGGGRSRVMKAGRVFEQGGVNFSEEIGRAHV